jgi:transposase-like protein/IS1 family transposase
VTCHRCQTQAFKFGIQNGFQRYRCKTCKRTFSDIPSRPLDTLRVEPAKAYQVIHMLVEGVGIRAIERLTGLNRRTVLAILATAGDKCARLMDSKVRNVKAEHVQVDELYAFVNCKQMNTTEDDELRGDFYTFLSVAQDSKLVINWRTSKRTAHDACRFLHDLKRRVPERFQLTTDAWSNYCGMAGAVRGVFGQRIDYGTETKYFGTLPLPFGKFTTRKVIGIRRHKLIGDPDRKHMTTSHVERTNLSVRLFTRRFTRLTLGYSKKVENLRHSVALFVAHFNFCRVHSAHGKTPAQAAGLTDRTWTVADLMEAK